MVVDVNPRRVSLVFMPASDNYFVSLDPKVATGLGMMVEFNGFLTPTISLILHGDLVRRAWYGIPAGGADVTVTVFESETYAE